jgi:hypothetical protein
MSRDEREDALKEERSEANTALGTGLGIGAFGVASAALIGSVCPVCVVAAPALIGYGVFKRVQCSRKSRNDRAGDAPAGSSLTLEEET